ncbi:MAG: NOP5/NOP56 family protein [Thermoplasmataceae archaeon]
MPQEQIRKEIKWFGISEGETNINYFSGLETESNWIFNELREGNIPETAEFKGKLPDLRPILIEFGWLRLKEELGKDRFLVKIFQLLQSMDEIINLYYEKVSGLEVFMDADNHTKNMNELFMSISNGNSNLMGSTMKFIGEQGNQLIEFKKQLISIMNKIAVELMPNTTKLIGESLASELLSRAGNLQRLALFSASAIQLTGAERSLFQHLSKGTDPPKHGVIYKSSLVASAPDGRTGRRARRLACKIAITARADMRNSILPQELIKKYITDITR